MGIEILGISSYLPENVVDNHDLSKIVDTSDEWIKSRSGISERRFAKDESVADLASKAVSSLLEKTKVNIEDVEVLSVASFTPEYIMPSIASQIHEKLSLSENMMCFDINAACTGFIYNLEIMHSLLASRKSKYGILVCAEKISSYLNFEDRSTCVLFGDGAAALLIKNSDLEYFVSIKTRGLLEPLYCRVNDNFKNLNSDEKSDFGIKMNGKEVFKFAVDVMRKGIEDILEKSSYKAEDIDYIVCHQANERIISHVSKKMKIDISKFYMNLQKYGNTSAASIPIALSEMADKGILKSGDRIICVGFGAGLSWGSALFKWN